MRLNEEESKWLSQTSGTCRLNIEVPYIVYKDDNWEAVQEFCKPFMIERSKINTDEGRAVIDLPSGNETFEYGMVLIRLGNKRVMVFTPSEFLNLFQQNFSK
ncbi:hypothetical protein [Enterococcus sp. AZ196]|uniref:hypothetical protein n=1 Tax=Enterococcus sp. AZ196 TaxID=2774659 RepID=UPI003D29CEFB